MACDETLVGRIRDEVAHKPGVTEKKMFGGVVFMLNGNMLVGVWKDSLIARVGKETSEAGQHQPHVRLMDITGKPMKAWLMIDPAGIKRDAQLKTWIKLATKFVSTLPSK
ncbi:MAG: TfoX/Sxy family protein [Planctomycetaceae bacterium]|nr:TfoX/Sxy family protein [Planctomycetaceae bacterium]